MKHLCFLRSVVALITIFMFVLTGYCTVESVDTEVEHKDTTEFNLYFKIDKASKALDDIMIQVYGMGQCDNSTTITFANGEVITIVLY